MYGSWHLGRLQVGLSRAIRLAQCHSCRITAREALAVQIDGEPWLQPPCSLDIALKGQVRALAQHPRASLRSVMEGGTARACAWKGCCWCHTKRQRYWSAGCKVPVRRIEVLPPACTLLGALGSQCGFPCELLN